MRFAPYTSRLLRAAAHRAASHIRAGCAGKHALCIAPALARAPDDAGFLDVINDFSRIQFVQDLLRVHDAHEQVEGERAQVFLTARLKNNLAPGVGHDGIIYLRSIGSDVKNLPGKLIGEHKMQAKASRLVEILGDSRGDEILELVNVNVEWLHLSCVCAFAAFLCCRPEVTHKQSRKQRGIFFGHASAFG